MSLCMGRQNSSSSSPYSSSSSSYSSASSFPPSSSPTRVESVTGSGQAADMEGTVKDLPNSGVDNSADAAKKKHRSKPCCGFCRNHLLKVPVINHHCPYATCKCIFCELTRKRRKVMRHQLRLWRFKKCSGGWVEGEENSSEGELTQGHTEDKPRSVKYPARRTMVCDKCRNHNILVKKRGHKGSCPYEECTCAFCSFTIKRQQLMKHQQRVRRSQVAAPAEHTEMTHPLPQTDADSPASDVQTLEEASPTGSPWNKCDERKEEGVVEVTRSPHPDHPMPCHEVQPSEEWTNTVKECSKSTNSTWPQDDSHVSIIPQAPPPPPPPPPPPLDPVQEFHKTSEVSPTYSKTGHSLNSPPAIECTDNMTLSVRYDCFRPLPQVPTAPASLPTLSKYGPEVGHPRYPPGGERVCGADRCMMGANNTYAPPQAPLRPQPMIPAGRLTRSQMEWHLMGFPYLPASMLQSLPQPSALSMCDNFRLHHAASGLDESWHAARAVSHHTEGGGVHPPYTAGLPYLTSSCLHPSAKPSLSLMSASRTLPEYGPPLPVFGQREHQHQDVHLGTFARNSSGNVI